MTDPLAVLQRIRERAAAPRPRPASGASCAPSRSPTSTTTSSTSSSARLMCACRGCYLLFTADGAGGGRYRAVPDRYLAFPDFHLSPAQWDALQIPVSVAFFFVNSSLDRVAAFYPSPAGATESLLSLDTWDELVGGQPASWPTLQPDVEAFLVRADARRRGRPSATSCRSTPATSWSASCGGCGAASTAGARPTTRSSAFFAGVRDRAGPCPERTARRDAAVVRGARRAGRAVRRGADAHAAAADHRGRRRSPSTPSRCGARSGSSRSGGTTTPDEEGRLVELFGETPRWGDTLRPFLWTHVATTVPGFTGATEIDLPSPCTYDFEVAAAKYLHALDDGEIPLVLLFSGTAFPAATTGFAAEPVAWHEEASYRLPVQVWRDDDGPLLPEQRLAARRAATTLDALTRFKAHARLPSVGPRRRATAEGSRGGGRVTAATDRFAAAARCVADAVLYEGYVLYPYRASAGRTRSAGSSACSSRRRYAERRAVGALSMRTEVRRAIPATDAVVAVRRALPAGAAP